MFHLGVDFLEILHDRIAGVAEMSMQLDEFFF